MARSLFRHGLPADDSFVIANFNSLEKLDPRAWGMLQHLTKTVPGGRLWLSQYPPSKSERVKRLASEAGDEPSMLKLAECAPFQEHGL